MTEITVGMLWGIWIGTFLASALIIALILWLFRGNNYKSLSWGIAVFIALIIAAIVTYGCAGMVDVNTLDSTQHGWYYALLAVVVVLPILSLIYLMFFANDFSCFKKACPNPCDEPVESCDPCKKPKPDCDPCKKPAPKPECEPCKKPAPKPECEPCKKPAPKPCAKPCAPCGAKPVAKPAPKQEHHLTHEHVDLKVKGVLSYDEVSAS